MLECIRIDPFRKLIFIYPKSRKTHRLILPFAEVGLLISCKHQISLGTQKGLDDGNFKIVFVKSV